MAKTIHQEPASRSLREAFETLRIAEREFMRPSEDAVTLCACQSVRVAAGKFLHSFLLINGCERSSETYLADLLKQCAGIDPHFKTIDLSCFDCGNTDLNCCDEIYCLTLEKVNECLEKTQAIRELVMTKLKLREKDFC